MFGKQASVAWAEVELHGQRCFELVLHPEDAVGTALPEVASSVPDAKNPLVLDGVPTVTDAGTKTYQTVQVSGQTALEHDVGVQLKRPETHPVEVNVFEPAVRGDVFGAQIHLEGKVIATEGFKGQSLHVADRYADAVFIRGLRVGM